MNLAGPLPPPSRAGGCAGGHLRADDGTVTPALQYFPEQLFRPSPSVFLCGVKKVDARVQTVPQHPLRLWMARVPLQMTEGRALAVAGNREIGPSNRTGVSGEECSIFVKSLSCEQCGRVGICPKGVAPMAPHRIAKVLTPRVAAVLYGRRQPRTDVITNQGDDP